jgi:tetratricopeptide (TPR) repeat protein
VALFGGSLSAGDLPDLTDEVVDSLPEEIREDLVASYQQLRLNPTDPVRVGQLGMIFHAYEQYRIAELLYEHARLLAPEAFEWAYYLGVVRGLEGDFSDGIGILRDAVEMSPTYIPAKLKLAEYLQAENQWEASRDVYEEVLEEYPEMAVAQYGAGRAYFELQIMDQAVKHLSKACELFERYGQAHYTLGLAYRSLGEMDKAAEQLKLYQANRLIRPVVGDGLLELVEQLRDKRQGAFALLEEGVALGEKGQLEEAIAKHLEALEGDPNLLQAHVNLIILYGRAGQTEEAERQYKKAIQLAPNSADLHYNFGLILFSLDRYSEAAELFKKSIEINPLNAMAYNNLGQMLERQARFQEAVIQYRKAVEVDRQYRTARYNLARMLLALKRNEEAITELEQLLSPEDERTAIYTYALGAAYVRSGNLKEGLRYTEAAQRLAEKYNQEDILSATAEDLPRIRQALVTQP